MNTLEYCENNRACSEGVEWAKQFESMTEVWDRCERGDWLLWIMRKNDIYPRETWVKLAIACAKPALKFVPAGEDRPRLAIEAVEKWLENPTPENLHAAYAASDAASDAAYYAAYYAAYAASDAAYYAASAASYASSAASSAASYASSAAQTDARKAQAEMIRGIVANPFLPAKEGTEA